MTPRAASRTLVSSVGRTRAAATASGTLDAWRDKLLAYFDTGGVSNGPTEAVSGLIKKVKRVGGCHGVDVVRLIRLAAPWMYHY